MGFIQRWLDEPDQSIARLAKLFYGATFLFMAMAAWQTYLLVKLSDPGSLRGGDVAAPLVSMFLTLTMYNLAIDGRRSYRVLKAKEAAAKGPEATP